MENIRVNLKKTEDKSYDIVIEEGVLKEIPSKLKEAGDWVINLQSSPILRLSLYMEPIYQRGLQKMI